MVCRKVGARRRCGRSGGGEGGEDSRLKRNSNRGPWLPRPLAANKLMFFVLHVPRDVSSLVLKQRHIAKVRNGYSRQEKGKVICP